MLLSGWMTPARSLCVCPSTSQSMFEPRSTQYRNSCALIARERRAVVKRRNSILIPALMVLLFAAGCKRAPAPATEVIAVQAAQLPAGPADAAWDNAPEYVAKLIPQDLVEPRLAQPSTPEVRVQAMTNGTEIAFRLRWVDQDRKDTETPGQFVDACAVQ